MLRQIQVQGPVEAIEAVTDIGCEGLLDFQDYFYDRQKTYSAFLVIFDDVKEAECEVLEQVRTLLDEKGVDPSTFSVTDRLVHYPDALAFDWYKRIAPSTESLMALEALGVRDESQQLKMDHLREEIRWRVAVASEVAELHVEQFMTRISDLFGK
jgi:hypothetical protein